MEFLHNITKPKTPFWASKIKALSSLSEGLKKKDDCKFAILNAVVLSFKSNLIVSKQAETNWTNLNFWFKFWRAYIINL